jgi:hypothetical protein
MNKMSFSIKTKLIVLIITMSLVFSIYSLFFSLNTTLVSIDAETISEVTTFSQTFTTTTKGNLFITQKDNIFYIDPSHIQVKLPEAFLVNGKNPSLSPFYVRNGKSPNQWEIAFQNEGNQSAFANWTARNISRWIIKNYFIVINYQEMGFICKTSVCNLKRENEINQLNIEKDEFILKQTIDVPVSKTTNIFKVKKVNKINISAPIVAVESLVWTSLENEAMTDQVRAEVEVLQINNIDSSLVLDEVTDEALKTETLKKLSLLIKHKVETLTQIEQLISTKKIPLRHLFRVIDALDRSGNDLAHKLIIKYFEAYPYSVKSKEEELQARKSILSILAYSKFSGNSKDLFFFSNLSFSLNKITMSNLDFNFYLMAAHYLRANKIKNVLSETFVKKINLQLSAGNKTSIDKLLNIVGNTGDDMFFDKSILHFLENKNLVIMALRFMRNPEVENFYKIKLESDAGLTNYILQALQFRTEEGIELSQDFKGSLGAVLEKRTDENSKTLMSWLASLKTN